MCLSEAVRLLNIRHFQPQILSTFVSHQQSNKRKNFQFHGEHLRFTFLGRGSLRITGGFVSFRASEDRRVFGQMSVPETGPRLRILGARRSGCLFESGA